MWRGGLGWACLFPALSFAGASLSKPCSVSTSRSSTGQAQLTHPAPGGNITVSPTKSCASAPQAGPNQTYRAGRRPSISGSRDLPFCVWRTTTAAAAYRCVDPPPVGFADRPETEVVGPTVHHLIELRHYRLMVQLVLLRPVRR